MRGYNAVMETELSDYLDAIEHLPQGTSLIIHELSWDDYEKLLEVVDRPSLRAAYDCGRSEIVSPLPEHRECLQRNLRESVFSWANTGDVVRGAGTEQSGRS